MATEEPKSRIQSMTDDELEHELYFVGMKGDEAVHDASNYYEDDPEYDDAWDNVADYDRYFDKLLSEKNRR